MTLNGQRAGLALSALTIGAFFFVVILSQKTSQKYSEFIVSSLALHAGTKTPELLAWPAFIVASFLAWTILSANGHNLHKNHGADVSSRYTCQLLLWSIPFYASIATLFLTGVFVQSNALLSWLGIVALAFIGMSKGRTQQKPCPELWSVTLFIALLLSLIPIEFAVLFSRTPSSWIGNFNHQVFSDLAIVLIPLFFLLAIFLITLREQQTEKHLLKALFLAQLGLPLFFLTLYPAKMMQPSGELARYETTVYLIAFISALVLFGWFDVVKRFRASSDPKNWAQHCSPVALFGLVAALLFGQTEFPQLSDDDFHFGEYLIGWWSYLNGSIPYVNHFPVHGLLENDLSSFLSSIFYDGTAVGTKEAGRVAFVSLGLVAFMSIYFYCGSPLVAVAVMMSFSGRLLWYFFIPFICLLLSHRLRTHPSRWLSVWVVSSLILMLGVPAQGLLLSMAFGPLAVKMVWNQIRFGDRQSWIELLVVVVSLLFALTATPLALMLNGALQYVLQNGKINQIAYGIPWKLTSGSSGRIETGLEMIRMSWVAIPFVCLCIMRKHWAARSDPKSSFYVGLLFFIFFLSLVPYCMGRIDADWISRAGWIALFGWSVVFPLLLWTHSSQEDRSLVVFCVVFMSALLNGSVRPLYSFNDLFSVAAPHLTVPPLRDSALAGLPNIGRVAMNEHQWVRINKLNKLLRTRLNRNETYLDLSSRNAHYFYLNRLPPVPITAPYNMASLSQQQHAIDLLTAKPPRLAILQADNIIHDGGGLALRTPLLHRFIVDHYTPRMESGFIVGYLKSNGPESIITAEVRDLTDEFWLQGFSRSDVSVLLSDPFLATLLRTDDRVRLANGETRAIRKISAEQATLWLEGSAIQSMNGAASQFIDLVVSDNTYREYNASLFQRSFSLTDLQKIPISWGRSQQSLQSKMTSPIHLSGISPKTSQLLSSDDSFTITGDSPQIIYDISTLAVSGKRSGLLKFDFECLNQRSDPKLKLFWWGDEREGPFLESSLKFTASSGTLIVPLDASPWWLHLQRVKGLRFDLDTPSACSAISVKKLTLYQRASISSYFESPEKPESR